MKNQRYVYGCKLQKSIKINKSGSRAIPGMANSMANKNTVCTSASSACLFSASSTKIQSHFEVSHAKDKDKEADKEYPCLYLLQEQKSFIGCLL